jgi:hypothetical protein
MLNRSVVVNEDIGPILERWPYGEDANVRKIVGADGTEKIQIRLVMEGLHGLLQFNCDGRPDGKLPHGRPFALDYYEERLRSHPGDPGKFQLTREQAAELLEESSITYQRYVILLQMDDYHRVVRDTMRNMRLFRFLHAHAADSEDRNQLEKWWPYVLRIHHTAHVMLCLREEDYDRALSAVHEARRELDDLPPQEDEVFDVELKRSRKALDEMEKTIEARRPPSELDLLEREKKEAVRKEDYQRAARLRDRIQKLKTRNERDPG